MGLQEVLYAVEIASAVPEDIISTIGRLGLQVRPELIAQYCSGERVVHSVAHSVTCHMPITPDTHPARTAVDTLERTS